MRRGRFGVTRGNPTLIRGNFVFAWASTNRPASAVDLKEST
jgi:hypothetical protein